MSRMTRILILFVLLSTLALPGTAQASPTASAPSLSLSEVLSRVWEEVAQWLGTGTPDAPEDDGSYVDGRGACDPNGVAIE